MSLASNAGALRAQNRWFLSLRWEIIGLLSVTLLAGMLRFYRLGDWSFWGDETYTLRNAVDLANINVNYPLWYLITHFSVGSLGISEWSARLPAAIVGTLAIPLTYVVVRRVSGGSTALIAALFLAVSPWHLYWSQNARFYILLSLLTSLALLTLYIALEEDRPRYLLASLTLFGLGVLTHTTGLFALGAAGAYLLVLGIMMRGSRPRGLNKRNLGILAAAAALPAAFVGWRVITSPVNWAQFLQWVNNDPFWLGSVVVYYLGVPTVCMAMFSAAYWICRRGQLAILLTLATVIPVAAIIVASSFTYSASRYMFVAAVPCIILAARGAAELLGQVHLNAKWLGIGVIFLLAVEPLSEDVLYYRYQNGNRFDYRGAYRVVQERMQPNDLVLANEPLLGSYYLKGAPTRSVGSRNLATLVQEQRRTWYVSEWPLDEIDPRIASWVRQNTILVANLDVHARARNFVMRVYLFDPDRQPHDRGVAARGDRDEPPQLP